MCMYVYIYIYIHIYIYIYNIIWFTATEAAARRGRTAHVGREQEALAPRPLYDVT